MDKKPLVIILIIVIVIIGAIIIFQNYRNSPKIIKKSFAQGDLVKDTRSSEEVCQSRIGEIRENNPNLICELIGSERIDKSIYGFEEMEKKCINGFSPPGCFLCTYECK